MSWLDHYDMEKRKLEECLGVITAKYLDGDKFDKCDKIDIDSVRILLSNLIRNYNNVFAWIRDHGSDVLKSKLHDSLLDYFPTYKNDAKLDLNFDRVLEDYFDCKSSEQLINEYCNSLINRKFSIDELNHYHKDLIKFHSNLISFKRTLDNICRIAFGFTLDGRITSVESLEYGKEYKDMYLIVNALNDLKCKRIPNKNAIISCSLFGDDLPNLYQNRKLGFVYDYKFERVISMETEDSYCILIPEELTSTKSYVETLLKSLFTEERINLENRITYTMNGLCRVLPFEYLRKNTDVNSIDGNRRYNEIVIDGEQQPSAIFVIKGALSEEKMKAFSFVYDLPVIVYDEERGAIRKIDYRIL